MKRNLQLGFLFLVIFIILTALLKVQFVLDVDTQLTLVIYNLFKSPALTSFLVLITDYTIATSIALFIVALLLHIRHTFTTAFAFVMSTALLITIAEVLKAVLQRPRPYDALSQIVYLGAQIPSGLSFPSSHSTVAFFAAYFMIKVLKLQRWKKWLVYGLAALVAISRIYLGAHYVLDTVAGAALGLCAGEFTILICKIWLRTDNLSFR